MAQSIGTAVSLPSELQQQQQHQQQHGGSMQHRQLYNNIIRGFEHLLQRGSGCSEQQGNTDIDGRGAGYVVWMPRREQYQEHREVWDGAGEQGEEGEGGNPLVLYGGGYDGLFKVNVWMNKTHRAVNTTGHPPVKCLVASTACAHASCIESASLVDFTQHRT